MTTLSQRAAQIRKAEADTETAQIAAQKQETDLVKNRLFKAFETAFSTVLPLLKEAGISYSVHYQNERYFHMGTYILFATSTDTLKMDFSGENSYRYEHVKYDHGYASMCYGKWDMDRFIVWIDEKLINGAGAAMAKKGFRVEGVMNNNS